MRWKIGLYVVLALGMGQVLGQTATAPDLEAAKRQTLMDEVARAVRLLGDAQYSVREEASRELIEMGPVALPALKEAKGSQDAEVAGRVEKLMQALMVVVTPDTPADVAAVVEQYAAADKNGRINLIGQLGRLGNRAMGNLLTLAEYESDPQLAQAAQGILFGDSHGTLRRMAAEGKVEQAEAYMEVGSRLGKLPVVREWAAYMVLHGRYDEARTRLEGEAKKLTAEHETERQGKYERLAYLYRANGDLAGAMAAAKEAKDATLEYALMLEQGDWQELTNWDGEAKLDSMWKFQADTARAMAAYYAGDLRGYAAWMEKMRSDAAGNNGDQDRRYPDLLCFLNRPDEAGEAMVKAGMWSWAMDLWAARGKYDEALALAERAEKEGARDLIQVKVKKGLILYGLGETEKGQVVLDEVTADVLQQMADAKEEVSPEGQEPGWNLNEQVGIIAQARRTMEQEGKGLELAGRFLGQYPPLYPGERRARIFYDLYRERSDDAAAYAVLLHEIYPEKDWAVVLKETGDILAHRMEGEELEELAKAIYAQAKVREEKAGREGGGGANHSEEAQKAERLRQWANRLGKDLAAAGVKGEFAEQMAREGKRPATLAEQVQAVRVRCRTAAKAKEWEKMATAYGDLARIENKDWPLCLEGWALVQAGKKEEGEALQKRAELLMQGSSGERYALGDEAKDVGAWEISQAQYEWVLRVGEPLGVDWNNAAQEVAMSEKVEAGRAARLVQEFMVAQAGSRAIFVSEQPDIALHLAWQQHLVAAKAAAARKDWAGVMAEVEAEKALYPEDVDGVLEIVPVLDAAGRKEDADRVVEMTKKYFEEELAKYPRAATKHNGLAWICGKTGRHLDEALQHAQKATEYLPKGAGCWDTLAEVHFARGEVQEAITAEKRALELEPDWALLREQLARFERGAGKGR